MAGPGYTFIDGVNELVETIGEFPMTGSTRPSAAGDTTSVYYLAERHLDRFNKRVQAHGWPENTVFSRAYTPAPSTFEVPLASTVLRIQSASSSEGRPLVIRVDTSDSDTPKIFDASLNSFNLGSDATVYVDQVELLSFEDLPPQLQDVILTQARTAYQRMFQGNLNLDSVLEQEKAASDAAAPRIDFDARRPFNPEPMPAPQPTRSNQ